MDGLNTAMPFGTRKIDAFRTLTTESLAVFIPFRVQDIYHENGIYYGQNVISKNMIIADRRQLSTATLLFSAYPAAENPLRQRVKLKISFFPPMQMLLS